MLKVPVDVRRRRGRELDLLILWKTVGAVLRSRGAY
jgi:hypothetical protein